MLGEIIDELSEGMNNGIEDYKIAFQD